MLSGHASICTPRDWPPASRGDSDADEFSHFVRRRTFRLQRVERLAAVRMPDGRAYEQHPLPRRMSAGHTG